MSSSNFVTTEDGGRLNMFANETRPQVVENYSGHAAEAEKTNGRWAMIGILAALVSYAFTGQIIPGLF